MSSFWIWFLVIVWVACGFLAYRAAVTDCQSRFPTIAAENLVEDRLFAALISLFGPIGLLTAAIMSGGFRYGFSKW